MDEGKEKYGPRIVWVVRLPTMLSIYQPPPPSMKAPTAPSEGPFNYCFAKNAAAAPLLVVIFLARPEYWIPRAQRCGGYEHGENSLLFSHDRRPPGSLALMKFVLVLCKQFGLPV